MYCQSNDASSKTELSGTSFEQCSVTRAEGYGGAIYSRGRKLTLQDSTDSSPVTITGCTANGYSGAVCMETSGSTLDIKDNTLISSCYAKRGGAIYLKNGVTMNISDSPEFTRNGYATLDGTLVNTAAGACIYLEEGSRLNLQDSPRFSRNNLTNQARIVNGGITDYARQDVYIAGYAGKDAASIHIVGELSGDTIWVWPELSPHRLHGEQFAMTASSGTVSTESLAMLRNALSDSTTGCSNGEYLAGVRLPDKDSAGTKVYWSKMYDISFKKIDNKAVAVSGAEFTLFTDAACTEIFTSAVSADGEKDTDASGELLQKGMTDFASVPIGVYYMKETKVPLSFQDNSTVYLVLVGSPSLSPNDNNRDLWEGDGVLNVPNAATLVARYTTNAGKYFGIFAILNNGKADLSKNLASANAGIINVRSDYEAYFMKADGSGSMLPNAEFTIYTQETNSDGEGLIDSEGYPKLKLWSRDGENYPDPVKSADGTDSYKRLDGTNVPKGMVYFRELPIGTYYLVETTYPTRNGNNRISFFVEEDRVFRLEVRGKKSDGKLDFTLKEWQEGGSYKELKKVNDYYQVNNTEAVCKLTDGSDELLYTLGHDGERLFPAIYSTLEAGIAAARDGEFVNADGRPTLDDSWNPEIKLKVLKDFTLTKPVSYDSTRLLTITTAELTARVDDKYVYATSRTTDTSRAEIRRGYNEPGGSDTGADETDALITVLNGSSLTLQNIHFNGQKSSQSGRAIHVKEGGTLNIQDRTEFEDFRHKASSDTDENGTMGGAILMDEGTSLNINGGTSRSALFTGNEIVDDVGDTSGAYGGALFIGRNCLVSLTNAQFTGNNASSSLEEAGSGGAISISDHYDRLEISFRNLVFTSNTASYQGGAIHVGSNNDLHLQDNEFTSNTASHQGGAIHVGPNNALFLENNKIRLNRASYGSAVFLEDNASLSVSDGTVSENIAEAENGGAINGPGNGETTDDDGSGGSGGSGDGTNVSFSFSGKPYIYNNIGTSDSSSPSYPGSSGGGNAGSSGSGGQRQRNVVLSQDLNTIINTTSQGLEKDARIGIYVIDGEDGKLFQKHGIPGAPFGTFVSTDRTLNLASFTNDRDESLYGVKKEGDEGDLTIYWVGSAGSAHVILVKVLQESDNAPYKALSGKTFTIYTNSAMTSKAKGTVLDSSGRQQEITLENLGSGAGGAFFIGDLPYGTYYISESEVSGYFEITIDKGGVVTITDPSTNPVTTQPVKSVKLSG